MSGCACSSTPKKSSEDTPSFKAAAPSSVTEDFAMNKHCTVKNAPEPSALKAPYAMDPPPLTPVTSPYAIAQGTAAPLPVGLVRQIARRRAMRLTLTNNAILYNAALAGFGSGVYFGRDVSAAPTFDFTDIVAQAEVFATAMDGAIPAGKYTQGQADTLQGLVSAIYANKYSTGLAEVDFEVTAGVIATYFLALVTGFAPVPSTSDIQYIEVDSDYTFPTGENVYAMVDTTSAVDLDSRPLVLSADSAPTNMQVMGVKDEAQNFATLGVAVQARAPIEYPPGTVIQKSGMYAVVQLGTYASPPVPQPQDSGISVQWQYNNNKGLWLCM
jgi:hypothetical protein